MIEPLLVLVVVLVLAPLSAVCPRRKASYISTGVDVIKSYLPEGDEEVDDGGAAQLNSCVLLSASLLLLLPQPPFKQLCALAKKEEDEEEEKEKKVLIVLFDYAGDVFVFLSTNFSVKSDYNHPIGPPYPL